MKGINCFTFEHEKVFTFPKLTLEDSKMANLEKVLVIDDDEINNFVCAKVISQSGYADEVKTLLSGQEGLDYLKEAKNKEGATAPDLILLDINMPLMDGWDFLEVYRKMIDKFDRLPVLFMLSSSVYEEDIEKARKYPEVSDYITKPLTPEVLTNIYQKYFQNMQ